LYKRNTHNFFGEQYEVRSQGSIYDHNKNHFYGVEEQPNTRIVLQKKNEEVKEINKKSGLYKKDQAKFFGVDYSDTQSQGSVFQKNAANFFGEEQPGPGQRPWKIQKILPD